MLLSKDACGERRHRCSKAHGQSQSCPRCQLELAHRYLGMQTSCSKPNSFSKSQNSVSTDPRPATPEIKIFPHLNPKKAHPYKPFLKRHGTKVASQQSPRTPDSVPRFPTRAHMLCWARICSGASRGLCRTAGIASLRQPGLALVTYCCKFKGYLQNGSLGSAPAPSYVCPTRPHAHPPGSFYRHAGLKHLLALQPCKPGGPTEANVVWTTV